MDMIVNVAVNGTEPSSLIGLFAAELEMRRIRTDGRGQVVVKS